MIDQWMLQHAADAQVGLFFTLFAAFGLAEMLAPKRPGPQRRRERWGANLLLTVLNIAILSVLPITFLSVALWAQAKGAGLFNILTWPLALSVVANLLARGFVSFFTHWLSHEVPLFWRVHRVHHLDTELDISTTVRFHPVEFGINLLVGVPIVLLLGLSPWVLMLYEILDAGITLFSHANVRIPQPLERGLRYLVVTPDLHRIHHSSWQPETDSNFGAVFPVWDIIFGTFRTEARDGHQQMQLGLGEVRDERAARFFWLLKSPILQLEEEDRYTSAHDEAPNLV